MPNSNFDRDVEIKKDRKLKYNDITVLEDDGSGNPVLKNVDVQASAGSIGTTELADNAVTSDKIANSAVLNNKLGGSITESKILRATAEGGQFIDRMIQAVYDFSADGGSQGTITLADSGQVPGNTGVILVGYDVITTLTSSGDAATVKVGLVTDGDLSTAIAINDAGNPWDAGVHLASEITPLPNKTTGTRAFTLTIATEDLTAGKIVFYFQPLGSSAS